MCTFRFYLQQKDWFWLLQKWSGLKKRIMKTATRILKNCSYIINTSGPLQRFAYFFSIHCSPQLKIKMDQNIFMRGICPGQFQFSLDTLSGLYTACSTPGSWSGRAWQVRLFRTWVKYWGWNLWPTNLGAMKAGFYNLLPQYQIRETFTLASK